MKIIFLYKAQTFHTGCDHNISLYNVSFVYETIKECKREWSWIFIKRVCKKEKGRSCHCLLTINKNTAPTTVQSSFPQNPNHDLGGFREWV